MIISPLTFPARGNTPTGIMHRYAVCENIPTHESLRCASLANGVQRVAFVDTRTSSAGPVGSLKLILNHVHCLEFVKVEEFYLRRNPIISRIDRLQATAGMETYDDILGRRRALITHAFYENFVFEDQDWIDHIERTLPRTHFPTLDTYLAHVATDYALLSEY